MYNSFPEMTSKYRMGVSRVLSLLNSDIFDITLTLCTSVSMYRIAHSPRLEGKPFTDVPVLCWCTQPYMGANKRNGTWFQVLEV